MKQQQYQKIVKSGVQGSIAMGRTYTIIGSIFSIIIGIILLMIGVIMILNKNVIHVQGTIIRSKCHENVSNSSFECDLSVLYQYQNKDFTIEITNYKSLYPIQINDIISLYINNQNPSEFSLYKTPFWFIILLIIIGSLLIFFSILYLSFILKYKGLAVIAGLKTVIKQ